MNWIEVADQHLISGLSNQKFKCALSVETSRTQSWSDILPKISKWKIIDSNSATRRHHHKFLEGCQMVIEPFIFL